MRSGLRQRSGILLLLTRSAAFEMPSSSSMRTKASSMTSAYWLGPMMISSSASSSGTPVCGAVGLLGLRNLCVSRLTHPRELLRVGQQLPVLIQSLDPARRRVGLTLRELLGTWQENAARFRRGAKTVG